MVVSDLKIMLVIPILAGVSRGISSYSRRYLSARESVADGIACMIVGQLIIDVVVWSQ